MLEFCGVKKTFDYMTLLVCKILVMPVENIGKRATVLFINKLKLYQSLLEVDGLCREM